jgi:hypothetical protein
MTPGNRRLWNLDVHTIESICRCRSVASASSEIAL